MRRAITIYSLLNSALPPLIMYGSPVLIVISFIYAMSHIFGE